MEKSKGLPQPADIQSITGSLYVTSGNEGDVSVFGVPADIFLGVEAHMNYFGSISSCNPDPA